jgi:hypothetical protein
VHLTSRDHSQNHLKIKSKNAILKIIPLNHREKYPEPTLKKQKKTEQKSNQKYLARSHFKSVQSHHIAPAPLKNIPALLPTGIVDQCFPEADPETNPPLPPHITILS